MKQIVLIGSIFVAVFLSVATYTCDADWCLVFAWQKQEKMVRDNMLVGDYLRVHISELAPEKEVLGGTYYVTQLTFTENMFVYNILTLFPMFPW